jgi:hypothetical protein
MTGAPFWLVPACMKSPTIAVITALGFFAGYAGAADATTPIDYTQRNQPYSAAESVTPQKQKPAANSSVQDKRVNPPALEKKLSPLRDREAAIDMKEAHPKHVRVKDTHRPGTIEHSTSGFNHRPASITTGGDTSKPPIVTKYQDSLAAASATNMARFPAMDRATSAKINRFVFRKNPPDAAAALSGSAIVPAAAGSAGRR